MKSKEQLRRQLLEVLENNIEEAIDNAYTSEGVDEEGYLDSGEFDAIVVTALQNVLSVKRTLVRN